MSGTKEILFNKLALEGFGPYREKTEFIFAEGINSYIAGNETGKTTMVAGLIATIFGLSHRQRTVSSFNLERFRNWDNPRHCLGELYFSVNGQNYFIFRDFDTHRVELWLMEENGDKKNILAEGTHNPEARKNLQAYDDMLVDLLGINSRELFSDTFCVEQPLPEPENISSELQGLLAGGKGTPFQSALKKLVSELKFLTKYTGPNDRGITAKNLSKEGLIEELDKKIGNLEKQIVEGEQSADSLITVQKELAETEAELKDKNKEFSGKEKVRQSWSEWQVMSGNYRNAARDRDKLQQALTRTLAINEKINDLYMGIERDYPEFGSAPVETGDYLTELANIDKQIRETLDKIKILKENIEKDKEEYRKKVDEQDAYPGGDLLGSDPVEKLKYFKRLINTCKNEWDVFQNTYKELSAVDEVIHTKYAVFEDASPEDLEIIREYNSIHTKLIIDLENKQRELKFYKAKLENYEKELADFNARYSDLHDLPAEAGETIEKKLNAIKKTRESDRASNIKESSATPILPKILGAVFLSVIFALIGMPAGRPFIFIMIVVGAILGFWLTGYLYRKFFANKIDIDNIGDAELKKIFNEIASYDRMLGAYASASEAELGSLSQRLRYYEEVKKRLSDMADNFDKKEAEKIESAVEVSARSLKEFEKRTERYTAKFNDVANELNNWRNSSDKRESLKKQLANISSEKFGCSFENAGLEDQLSEKNSDTWREAALYLKSFHDESEAKSIALLAESINSLSEGWWREQEDNAVQFAKIKKEIDTLNNSLKEGEKRLTELTDTEKMLIKAKKEFVDLIPDIIEKNNGDIDVTLQKWKKMQQEVNEKKEAEIQLTSILSNFSADDIPALQSKAAVLQDNVAAIMHRWQEHVAANPGLPGTGEADDPEKVSDYLEKINSEIKQLSDVRNAIEEKRNNLSRQQAALEGVNPLNIAAAELELRELIIQKERLDIDADALEIAHKELSAAINEYRQTYRELLEKQASFYCRNISARPQRSIILDDNFNIAILEEGRRCAIEQLSKGARDQVYLSLRFALADLLADETMLPMIFDDPFTSTDSARVINIREILDEHKNKRQFIFLSHSPVFKDWGKALTVKPAN